MRVAFVAGLMIAVAAAAAPAAANGQGQVQADGCIQPISWDAWLAAKTAAEARDAAGDLVGALQYYLEYVRQAEGLGSPARVAWGKNNAAYMIIKMHRLDPTVDLGPAKRMLEEGLALAGATEDCRKVMALNLDSVKTILMASR
jgi:hypothetical protein